MDIEENINSKRGRGRGRGTRSRGRGRGRGRGRAKKNTSRIVSSDEEMSQEQIEETVITDEITSTILTETVEDPISNKENENDPAAVIEEPIIPPTIDMEADISQLEAPTFTTISRGPPEPMLRLKWDHKVSLIGEKVLNPMIHCCDQCDKPILVYGRMIPCKHIFCLKCARQEPIKLCPRCKDKVLRVEQSGLGTVFMCTHGGSRYGNNGCRRTYLSQRDLQAHINHRHITPQQQQAMSSETLKVTQIIDSKGINITPRKSIEMSIASSSVVSTPTVSRLPQRSSHQFSGGISSASASSSSSSITSSSRGNLITVPLQEAQQALGKVNLQQQQVSSTVVSSLNQLSVHHHSPAAEQVASASYYSNALLSYSGPNRPHSHTSTHSSSSHGMTAQNYGSISTIGSQSGTAGGIPTPPPPVVTHTHNVPLVPPPAHLSSQQSVVPPPPPPAPPQAPAYYAAYGQQYGQMPHYQFDQTNYPPSGAPNPSQWNQQYYR